MKISELQTHPPYLMVNVKGHTVKANKVAPQPKAPAGWYYIDPVHKTWVYPAVGSQDAKIFDQLWAAETMRESLDEKQDVKSYNNWIRYNPQSLKDDFEEYKKKETKKWRARAEQIGSRYPMFDTLEDFQQALDQAPIVNIDKLGPVNNLTKNLSLDDIKDMVGSYQMPRDVDRIVQGYENNVPLPLPIILKGNNGLWIMAGNTRQSTARVLGVTPRALLVDIRS